MGATCNLSASCASPGSSALTQPQKELQTTERLLPRPCSPGPPHDTYDSPYAMTMTYDIDTRQHGNNNAMQYVILRLWPARTSRAQRAASGEAARPTTTTTRSAIWQQGKGKGETPRRQFRRWMPDVLTPKVPRAGGFPKAPAPTPPVCIPFASAFQRPLTAHAEAR
jgi:hypothetical protein